MQGSIYTQLGDLNFIDSNLKGYVIKVSKIGNKEDNNCGYKIHYSSFLLSDLSDNEKIIKLRV